MATHIIKYTHREGKKLDIPEAWCGRLAGRYEVAFTDLQHYAFSAERGDIWGRPVCKTCIKRGIKAMTSG